MEDELRVHRVGGLEGTLFDQLPPVFDFALHLLPPRAILLALEHRQQGAERQRAVAHEIDLHRIADAEHPPVEVYLHSTGLALLR